MPTPTLCDNGPTHGTPSSEIIWPEAVWHVVYRDRERSEANLCAGCFKRTYYFEMREWERIPKEVKA